MRRRFVPIAIALTASMALAASACGDDATTTDTAGDGTGTAPGGLVVEGVDRDDGEPAELPDVDDLVRDGGTFTFETTGDPCVDIETIVVGTAAAEFSALSDEEQQAVVLVAVEPFGDEAIAAVEALIEADDPGVTFADDHLVEAFVGFDEITLEPCGWPLFGALFAVSEAAPVVACETGEAIADDEPVVGVEPEPHPDEPCDQDGIAPTSLPCFEQQGDDPDGDAWSSIAQRWTTVDCDSGGPVEWDGRVGAWVETTEAVAAWVETTEAVAVPDEPAEAVAGPDEPAG